jgi:putative Ca2+/H+ antiporter (TMEM165/GDT1 family)
MDFKMTATVFVTIFLAELGDKTQLATLLFASDTAVSKMTVFFSASLALVLAVGVGVLAGGALSAYVSERLLHYVAGVGFLAIGIWSLITA